MHMGLVTEVIFGRELVERIPALVKEWKEYGNGQTELPLAAEPEK